LLHTLYVNCKSWLLRLRHGIIALYQGFEPRMSETQVKIKHILDFTHAQFHSLPMLLTVFFILCILTFTRTELSPPQRDALAYSLIVNACAIFFAYFWAVQEKNVQLFDFLTFITRLFLNYFEHIPTLNDIIVTNSQTLNLVGLELSAKKITVISDLLEDYQDISTVLLDQSSFLEMDLMKELWKIIRGKQVYFLKYQSGSHLIAAEANQNKIWTEEGFLRDLGTLDNWLWWENHVGVDVPLTKEGLVSLCYDSRLYVPKMYVPITDVLLNNELKGHEEMANLQKLVWQEDFHKEKPETKIYRHGSSVDLATLNHTLLHEIAFPNCNITASMHCLNLPELRKLNLEGTNFQEFKLLTHLQNLHTLNLSQCTRLKTNGVDGVFWPYLKRLYLSGSNFDRLELLRDLSSLETIKLADCKQLVVPRNVIMRWSRLVDLDISGSNFSDLYAFQDLPSLQAVDLSKCTQLNTRNMRDVAFQWPNCETINLDYSNFDNLDLMSSMRNLLYFSANHCNDIYTYSVQAFFWPAIEVVLLSGSNFDDMFLIHNLGTLESLDLSNCIELHTRGFPLLYNLNLPRLKNLDLRGSSFDRVEILDNLPHIEHLKMFSCPNLIIPEDSKFHWPNMKKLDLEMSTFKQLNVQSQFMPKLMAYVERKSKEIESGDAKNLLVRASLSAGSFPATNSYPRTNSLPPGTNSFPAGSPLQSFVDTMSERYTAEDFSELDAYSCGNPVVAQDVSSHTGSAQNSENMRVTFKKSTTRSPRVEAKVPARASTPEDLMLDVDVDNLEENITTMTQLESDGYSERKSDTAELHELLHDVDDMEYMVHDAITPIVEVDEVRLTMEQLLATTGATANLNEHEKRSPQNSALRSKSSEHSGSSKSTPKRAPEGPILNEPTQITIDMDERFNDLKEMDVDNTSPDYQRNIQDEVEEKKSEYSEDFSTTNVVVGGRLPTVDVASTMQVDDMNDDITKPEPVEIMIDPIEPAEIIEEEDEYIPTVPCRYFQEGRCTRGEKCTFLHVEPNTVLPTNDVTKTKHCKFWRKGQCTKGNFCTFIHDPHSLMPLKTKVCKYHEAGLCLKGDHCTFVHVSQDKDAIIREIKSFVKLHQHGDKGALFVKLLQSMKFDHTRFGHKRAIDFVQTIPGIQIERKPQVELFLDEHDDFMKPRRQMATTSETSHTSLASEGETGSTHKDLENTLPRRQSPLPQPSSTNNLMAFFNNPTPIGETVSTREELDNSMPQRQSPLLQPSANNPLAFFNSPTSILGDPLHEFSRPAPGPPRQQGYYQPPPMQPATFNFMMPFFPNNTYLPEA